MRDSPRSIGQSRAPARFDVMLGTALVAFAGLEVLVYKLPVASVVSVIACGFALVVRRRLPLAVACAAGAASVVDRVLGGPWVGPSGPLLAAVLGAYSVACFGSRRQALVGGALVLAGVWLRVVWSGLAGPLELGFFGVLVVVQWLAGLASRAQRQRTQTLETLTLRLERERDAVARLVVAEERARLARELHDAVAGAVRAMLSHAESAERLVVSSPDRARDALRATQDTGRGAIGDLGRMLRVLRSQRQGVERGTGVDNTLAAPPRWRVPFRWSSREDALLAVATLVLMVVEERAAAIYEGSRPLLLVLLVPLCGSLALRRRYPVAMLLVATSAGAVRHILAGPLPPTPVAAELVLFAATYSAAAYAPARRCVPAAVAAALELWVADALIRGAPQVTFLLALVFYFGVPFLSGRAVRAYRLQAERLHVLAERLRRERDARARLAVIEERTRVARELHDTVAHGVSAMVLHAGAGEQLLRSAPGRCEQALHTVRDVGRETLDELGRLLGILGLDAGPDAGGGRPTLGELTRLIANTRRAGLPVTLHIEGSPGPLPASVDASAFRIVQESLTNALKHAGAVATDVTVRYERDGVALAVINAAGHKADRRPVEGGGHGLVGMRERVALHHGNLQVGPQPSGGFRVRAHLPLASQR
jgi:signal transduction histidine kinase